MQVHSQATAFLSTAFSCCSDLKNVTLLKNNTKLKNRTPDLFHSNLLLPAKLAKLPNLSAAIKTFADANEVTGDDFLQFAASVWGADKNNNALSKSASVAEKFVFPCLGMEPSWSGSGDLMFGVHLKPNQALRHLSQGSEHAPGAFSTIPHGVIGRLAKLAAATKESKNLPMNLLHPEHAEALEKAGLNPDICPTLKEVLAEQAATMKATWKEKRALQAQRR